MLEKKGGPGKQGPPLRLLRYLNNAYWRNWNATTLGYLNPWLNKMNLEKPPTLYLINIYISLLSNRHVAPTSYMIHLCTLTIGLAICWCTVRWTDIICCYNIIYIFWGEDEINWRPQQDKTDGMCTVHYTSVLRVVWQRDEYYDHYINCEMKCQSGSY